MNITTLLPAIFIIVLAGFFIGMTLAEWINRPHATGSRLASVRYCPRCGNALVDRVSGMDYSMATGQAERVNHVRVCETCNIEWVRYIVDTAGNIVERTDYGRIE